MTRLGLLALMVAMACGPAVSTGDDGGSTDDGSTDDGSTGEACVEPEIFDCPGENVCDYYDCVDGVGPVDENGCGQPSCSTTADCPDGRTCMEITLAHTCQPSSWFCDADAEGVCGCGGTADCTNGARCLDAQTRARHECVTDGRSCDELVDWLDLLRGAYQQDRSPELSEQLSGCAGAVASATIDRCGAQACDVVCRLHPCEDDLAGCVQRCVAQDLSPEALGDIAMWAAETFTQCTCNVCDDTTASFCEAVWGCRSG